MSEITSVAVTEAKPPEVMILDRRIWTYQDYCGLPNDGRIHQVVGGKLIMAPAPTTTHQRISRNLVMIVWTYIRQHQLGTVLYAPVDVVLSSTDVVQPDIVFVSNVRSGLVKKHGITGPPDLVVEILSPSTGMVDREFKFPLYERHGVREYLIIHPEERIVQQYQLRGGHYELIGTFTEEDTLGLCTVEGLEIPLRAVFEA